MAEPAPTWPPPASRPSCTPPHSRPPRKASSSRACPSTAGCWPCSPAESGPALIGETGTGGGVGLAWLASRAAPGARLVSVERDAALAAEAEALFADRPGVRVLTGDWTELAAYGPFDLLALDGGGQGKGTEPPLDVERWLRPGGLVVIDDFTPSAQWPPVYEGRPDLARLHWLRHPRLLATELPLTPTAATIVARLMPG